MGSFSIWHWLIVLVIVMLVFGTKKLRNIGTDLGGAVKGFKDGMKDGNGNASRGAGRPGQGTARYHHDRRGSQGQVASADKPNSPEFLMAAAFDAARPLVFLAPCPHDRSRHFQAGTDWRRGAHRDRSRTAAQGGTHGGRARRARSAISMM